MADDSLWLQHLRDIEYMVKSLHGGFSYERVNRARRKVHEGCMKREGRVVVKQFPGLLDIAEGDGIKHITGKI